MQTTRQYATGAWLDFVTITAMVDAAHLREAIAPFPSLDLARVPGAPDNLHPVCIDLSRVRDGRPEPGGVDQHTWSELAGAAAGTSVGGTLGAGAGGLWGAWMGPLGFAWGATAGWMAGAAFGAAAGVRVGRGVSETTSRTIGTYNEAMAFVPNVVTKDGRGPFLFSLRMHTDSPLSKRLAEVYRSGFGKHLAQIDRRGFDAYDVRSPEGALLCAFASHGERARSAPHAALAWLAQPVLGHVGDGVLAITHVDRFYDAPSVRITPVTGRLVIGEGFAPGLPAGELAIDDAFQATYVPVRLDYPVMLPG